MSERERPDAANVGGIDRVTSLVGVISGDTSQYESIAGGGLSDDEAVALAKEVSPLKRYCLVRDWVLVDVTFSRGEQLPEGVKPRVLYSGCIVRDQACRFPTGGWVRSTFEVSFTRGCLFETRNTVYVLSGDGRRATCDWQHLAALF
ncbi:DUF6957 family protein [Pseudomonas knackmussii]|uniref:DUF6957 family protein n=1 Tax=Pseudomonas knackmussii TaxID=65741 RepID=UPI003BC3E551